MVADAVADALGKMQVSAQPSTSSSSGKKKKNKRKKGRSGGTAQIKFSRTELVTSITLKQAGSVFKDSGEIEIVPKSAPILKKLGEAFERARWERSNFYWKPSVGAMYSGSIALGVDWDMIGTADTRAKVAAYAPSKVIPLREDGENQPLRMDPSRLKARNWYNYNDDKTKAVAMPARLMWVAEGESAITVGELYWTYTVILDGPHA